MLCRIYCIMSKNGLKRAVLNTKDIEIICEKSARTARRLMQQLKIYFEKQPWQFITIREFCEYMVLDEDEVRDRLYRAYNDTIPP